MTLRTSIVITAEQRQALQALGKLIDQLGRTGQAGDAAGVEINTGFGKARKGVESISNQLATLRREVIGFFSLRFTFGALADITRTAIEVQSLTNALKAVRGSGEAAADDLAFVRSESDRLGVSLQVALAQFVKLTAAAQGTKLAGQGVRDLFTALLETSVVLGLSQEQLDGALTAVQQIISKGKVSAEELRGQLGERLYGAFQIAARAIGLTTAELDKLLEQGLLPAERFLPAFARQLQKEFGGGVAEASTGARAEIERFKNSVLELKLQFAQSGFLDALASAFETITRSLSDPQFKDGLRQLGTFIGEKLKFVVEHAKEIAIFGAALAGGKAGARIGGAIATVVPNPAAKVALTAGGAAVGAVAGGIGASAAMSGGEPRAPNLSLEQRQALLERQIKSLEAAVGAASPKERPKIEAQLDAQRQRLADLQKAATEKAGGQGSPDFRDLLGGDKKLTRLPTLRQEFDQSAALIKDALERESRLLSEQLQDNLISIRDHYAARNRIAQESFDAESRRIQQERAQQEEFIAALEARRKGADPNQRAEIDDKVAAARERIKRLETELIMLGRQRTTEAQANDRAQLAATTALADEVERLKLETQELLGATSSTDRRQALETRYRELRKQLVKNRPEDVALLDRKINIEVGLGDLRKVESDFNAALDRMRTEEQSISNRRTAGVISESQARIELLDVQRRTAAVVEKLVPQAKALGEVLGPEVAGRVGAITVEFERLNTVVDDVAIAINGTVRDSFQGLFEDIASGSKSAKEIMRDLFRSIEQGISKIASQKVADQLFGGSGSGGLGGIFSALLSGGGFGKNNASSVNYQNSFDNPATGGGGGSGGFMQLLSSILPWFFHGGGLVGSGGTRRRPVHPAAFIGAPRLHNGGLLGLGPNEVPAILERGERVLSRNEVARGGGVTVNMTINTPDANSFRRSQGQIEAEMASAAQRGRRLL